MDEVWITTQRAAEITGYHRDHILRLVSIGKVQARKFATVWQVNRRSLLTYAKLAKELGSKRGPKTAG